MSSIKVYITWVHFHAINNCTLSLSTAPITTYSNLHAVSCLELRSKRLCSLRQYLSMRVRCFPSFPQKEAERMGHGDRGERCFLTAVFRLLRSAALIK